MLYRFNHLKYRHHNDRVATAQGKPGIWMFIFPDRENTGNLPKILKLGFYTGNLPPTQGKVWKIIECTRVVVECFCDVTVMFL